MLHITVKLALQIIRSMDQWPVRIRCGPVEETFPAVWKTARIFRIPVDPRGRRLWNAPEDTPLSMAKLTCAHAVAFRICFGE